MRTFLILIFALFTISVSAQNLRNYDVSSGLSENTVKSIVQDKTGYIWVGTQDGLNKFNGHEFIKYGCSYQQAHGPGSVNILNMKLHKDGIRLWIASREHVLLFDSRKEQFDTLNKTTPLYPSCFEYDSSGNLLIGTSDGILEYDEIDGTLHNVDIPYEMRKKRIYSILCDSSDHIWVCCESGLFRSQIGLNDFEMISNKRSVSIAEDHHENIWVGFWYEGLAKYNQITHSIQNIKLDCDQSIVEPLRVRNILCTDKGSLLLSTNHGLYDFHPDSGLNKRLFLKTNRSSDNIYCCILDRENGLWTGSYFKGLFYLPPNNGIIECYTPENSSIYFHGSAISSFCEESEKRVWIASENGGLSVFNPIECRFLELPFANPAGNIHSLTINGNYLYVGTFAQGLIRINLNSGETKSFLKTDGLPDNHVYCLKNSSDGNIYIGTMKGCAIFNTASESFSIIKTLSDEFIYDICQDSFNNIWFADYYNGLHKYDIISGSWEHFTVQNSCLPNNRLIGLWQDGESGMFICSDGGGLSKYDYHSGKISPFVLYYKEKPLQLSVIYGVRKDGFGRLWISSNHGLYCCDENGVADWFSDTDNLQSNQFNYGAVYSSMSGKLYFGGINGFNIINSRQILSDTKSVSPTVTATISYNDNSDNIANLNFSDNATTFIIPRNTRSIFLYFECLSYFAPSKNTFYYKVDGKPSQISANKTSISFVNFPYGKHLINVYATNAKGQRSSNEVVLAINNLPPLYFSIAAKILYCVLLLFSFLLFFNWFKKRKEQESEYQSYQAKMDFFTQIAHEIKTPVTLIKAPLELIMKNKHEESEQKNLETIEKNTSRLQNLIGQLLDFKKISTDGYRVCLQENNPVDVIRSVTSRFRIDSPEAIDIRLNADNNIKPCMMDAEAYVKIVSNLMSNALKHTNSFIELAVEIVCVGGQKVLHLSVSDDGDGIPGNEVEKIFNSFYQIGRTSTKRMGGVGLGLPLVKLLAEKHGGRVYMNESYTQGCQMCVDIPYIERASPNETVRAKTELHSSPKNILVVEDNEDMLDFLCSSLENGFTPIKARNGREAMNLLNDIDIELIISDLSMPEMDGYELLLTIRNDEILSFIPVILLTAESSIDAKIKCLEYGCNAFIEKPFSVGQLIATINNLITERNRIRANYLSPVPEKDLSIGNPSDIEFIEKVNSIVRAKIGDSEIPVDELADYMNMSRSSLLRKIKGLTGLTPIEFIRQIKMNKAAELLSDGKYRISEVCYMVGINKPSTFAAYFKEQFGVLPKEYIKTHKSS